MEENMRVQKNQEALSRAAAELFVEESRQAVETRGRFTVLLAGGETPRRAYELLARPPLRDGVPWHAVHVFWGDERCVPAEDPRSNARMARLALLDHVPIPFSQIHPITFGPSPRDSAERYEHTLRAFFQNDTPCFDLVFLGLGENGHTASLFPGTPAVEERERWAVEVYVAEEDIYRVTITAPLINRSSLVAFVVAGTRKSHILRQVLEGSPDPLNVPACLINPSNGKLLWLVDKEAASLLR